MEKDMETIDSRTKERSSEEKPDSTGPPGGVPQQTFRRSRSVDPNRIVPTPRFTKFNSEHLNSAQRSTKLWEWCASLTDHAKQHVALYIYREFPPLLEPEAGDYKYIDILPGETPITSDKELNDRYGAGDYKIFVNASEAPPGAPRDERTLAVAWVQGSRDFVGMPPNDKRITAMNEDGWPKYIDPADPRTKTYIEYLRGRGILKELGQIKKERTAMATAEAEKEKSAIDLLGKLVERVTTQPPPQPNANPFSEDIFKNMMEAGLAGARTGNEMLSETIKVLREQMVNNKGGGESTMQMLTLAMEIAKQMAASNNPAPYLEIIGKLNERMAQLQIDQLKDQIEMLRTTAQQQNNPAPPRKSALEELRDAKELLQELGLNLGGGGQGEEDTAPVRGPWWAQMLQGVLPDLSKVALQFLTLQMMQGQNRPPMPMGGMPPQPQPTYASPPAGIAAPTPQPPPQPGPQPAAAPGAPPANGAAGAPTDMMTMIWNAAQMPLLTHIVEGEEGDDFADWFIKGFTEEVYKMVVQAGPDALIQLIYSTQLGARLNGAYGDKSVPRLYVERFIHDFCNFNPDAYEKKLQKEEGEREPTPA